MRSSLPGPLAELQRNLAAKMTERAFHLTFFAIAVVGLALGLFAPFGGWRVDAHLIWSVATVPVILALAYSIVRDFLIGRMGVDAIALVSMTAAIVMGQPLAGVVVAIMYTGGNILEDYARGKAERDLKSLRDRTPRVAHKWLGDVLTDISVDEVQAGDQLLVRAGELLPVDGYLADPHASIDESAVTGEPLPVTRAQGELLRSGTVNAGEAFRLHASASASESTYAGIIRMVEAAQTAKAPFIRVADRFALFLLPTTLIVAGLAWWLSGESIRALAVLVVATPCPLILAAPVAFIGGVSRAAREGILMKGSAALEALSQIRTAIFDKTGTLTEGGARLTAFATAPGVSADEALRLLASLEQASHHVLAQTLIDLVRGRGKTLSHPREVREFRGSGIEGFVEGRRLKAGTRSLVLGGAPLPDWAKEAAAAAEDRSALSVYLSIDGRFSAIVIMADAVREDTPTALARLREAGVSRIIMVTGDDSEAAYTVARSLGLDEAFADKSPAEKVAAVEVESARQPTMMVGDGINDAPALAAANVGIAMGARGATASSEAADIVILVDRLDRVAEAYSISLRTRAIAMQSIVVGLGLSGIAMIAAAFGYITPVAGALLQEVIDIAVILNALRALIGPSGSTPGGKAAAVANPPRQTGEQAAG
ncbi:P-type E1-E2 ATPase/heavy metal translocating P-type ATPase [Pseudaminobacter salicylatoxidans]|uniref:P-type Zn(2+) transporter n=1 Tax=Pseudaminobacter salicylatoxidans TaxID=93369 RepID=A0A316CA53_PSESE|nr:heavy metal translocating P-type ATPase [Pseudaminobacter salicylatoxidans]PWJ86378.1 P-type E1-E2 ATPase/heavy metal translocating P-type ATPase [Pseudaminobacter salicylatoxidans]